MRVVLLDLEASLDCDGSPDVGEEGGRRCKTYTVPSLQPMTTLFLSSFDVDVVFKDSKTVGTEFIKLASRTFCGL